MDFPMQRAMAEALREEEKWDKGLIKIYEGLANDFHYPSPKDIMVFPDNHDMDRIHTQLGQDASLTKMAMAYLLMLPRIPQIYYGTEILMENSDKPGDHGLIRTDFPGGWPGDAVNAFSGEGLTEDQKDMQHYLKTLLNFRKNNKIIHEGKTVHFSPKEGVYILFRIKNDDVVVLILNKNDQEFELDLSRFKEIGIDERQMRNVTTGEKLVWEGSILLEAKNATVLTTSK